MGRNKQKRYKSAVRRYFQNSAKTYLQIKIYMLDFLGKKVGHDIFQHNVVTGRRKNETFVWASFGERVKSVGCFKGGISLAPPGERERAAFLKTNTNTNKKTKTDTERQTQRQIQCKYTHTNTKIPNTQVRQHHHCVVIQLILRIETVLRTADL